ncbi:MAG: L-threonylcarbamoyladenylate synthase [Candidatus Caldatribacteriota bacterium]|nr:L-threonylcarbamoyladenylate synthase [Candidatus Caldatribacteriota bacterium]
MKTKILEINPKRIDFAKIKIAAEEIKKGNLVAFPTETVYGLGADALNKKAVKKIFQTKGRPFNDPLITHIADTKELYKLSRQVPPVALKLAKAFWPGPLTLVLKKSELVSDIITAGLDTVAVRMPADNIALSLIREAQTPIVAPSANLFGRTSPTTAQHVADDLSGKIEMIIDGGKTEVGVESTVLDVTVEPARVLRAGGISVEKLKEVIGQVKISKELEEGFRSPGMLNSHYSPQAKLILVEKKGDVQVEEVRRLASKYMAQGLKVGIMAKEENQNKYDKFEVKVIGKGTELEICAANLFSILRSFDEEGFEIIIAEGLEEHDLGLAIMERLRKAAAPK